MGIKAPQYAAELVGLNTVGNAIAADGKEITAEDMARVKDLKLGKARWLDKDAGLLELSGRADVNTGTRKRTLAVKIMVDVKDPQEPRLTGAVG